MGNRRLRRRRLGGLYPMNRALAALVVGLTALHHRATAGDGGDEAMEIGNRLELFTDGALLAELAGLELRLHNPVPAEVAVVHDGPWEGNTCAYHTVFRDGARYRMYYRGSHAPPKGAENREHRQVTCYAESRDGIRWTKPELGLVEFDGSTRNNIVWDGVGTHNFSPFRDANPDCPPDERYKALASVEGGLLAFVSPDGLRWRLLREQPVITKGAFDSQNLAFWDPTAHCYREYHRGFRDGVRDIMTGTSADFLSWTEPVWLEYPGAEPEHLYTNQILPYPRAPHILVGFPKRFVPERKSPFHPMPGLSDGVFLSGRDGIVFKRWREAFLPPGPMPERWVNRNNMIAHGIVETKSALPGAPDELSLYATEGYYAGEDCRIRRFTLRKDGFVSLHGSAFGGEAATGLLRFAASEAGTAALIVNYATSAAGSLACELRDGDGNPLPGFEFKACDAAYGDRIDGVMIWGGRHEVGALAGTPVRVAFRIADGDVYSFRFDAPPAN